ncbi:olfactory receptor 5AR1-like [Pseudophryne corroboree]|uniref:olfactory receptor 5AR1-like n=1 Tax=Pseudophryne corroboree TaxID=495146 RepID=UPI0030818155
MQKNVNNATLYGEFYIMPFSGYENVKFLVLIGISITYLSSMMGNVTITLLVCLVQQLHTPMYFFLCNLSVQDMVYVSNIQPKLLAILITDDTRISFSGCITQIFLFTFCIDTEFFLLTSMAYDRFVAICKPLHYNIIMNKRTCSLLTCTCWIAAASNGFLFSLITSNLPFCKSHDIYHFFCEVETMLALTCTDTTYIFRIIFVEGFVIGISPLLLIVTSYVFIISSIMKIQTSSGRLKMFSSCSSHLTTVLLLYGTSMGSYMKIESELSSKQNEWVSMFYLVLVPMLNPLVYSLRNKDVMKAIKSLTDRCWSLNERKA